MSAGNGDQVLTEAAWAIWEPLIEAVRPREGAEGIGKDAPGDPLEREKWLTESGRQ